MPCRSRASACFAGAIPANAGSAQRPAFSERHSQIANARNDFLHQTSHTISKNLHRLLAMQAIVGGGGKVSTLI
ncbi:hypothetical protein D3C79_1055670 [compost metagenome]